MHVAVFLAANPGNLGMYSVDIAARQFFEKHRIPATYFSAQLSPETNDYGEVPIQRFSMESDLNHCTHIVFWGDFQNNPQYGKNDFAQRDVAFQISPNKQKGFERWNSIFFENGGLTAGRPTLSIGTSFASMDDREMKETVDACSGGLSHFSAVFPRDPLSLSVLNRTFPAISDITQLGLDTAFLLDPGKLVTHSPAVQQTSFCYFFHRSNLKQSADLVSEIESATGLSSRPLSRWLNTRHDRMHRRYTKLLKVMLESSFVLSDTYHVCVNALNAGVPVVSLGRTSDRQLGTLGDKKKEVLFDTVGASDRFISADNETTARDLSPLVEKVVSKNSAQEESIALTSRITRMRVRFESQILAALA